MLVVRDHLLSGLAGRPAILRSAAFNQVVALVESAELLDELVDREAALDVDEDAAELLAFVDLLRLVG
jgi:hypothetical protein